MVVELLIPEDEIAHVRQDLDVAVRLDAFPRRELAGKVVRVHPRSETKGERNVFIAEVHLENVDRALRPGMNGQARISADRHPLAWNLFHKPWQYLVSGWGW
jgi:multidrug efflux pump subunit AcrA (membrane-fusion protein)